MTQLGDRVRQDFIGNAALAPNPVNETFAGQRFGGDFSKADQDRHRLWRQMAGLLVVTNYAPFQRLSNELAELKSVRKINRHSAYL